MLTTTLDGLWVLQVLSGIEVLAPELGLRAHLPSLESSQTALAHPAADELREAGVIDSTGAVDDVVIEWLTVLARRDVALLLYAHTPTGEEDSERVLLARFAQWWVSLERCGHRVRLGGVGTASTEQSASWLISAQIDRLCGQMPSATMKPVTVEVGGLLRAVRQSGSVRTFLTDCCFDSQQVELLTLAADRRRSAQASVIAIQSGLSTGPARRHIGTRAVTILDTPQGRLVSEQVIRGGRSWMIVSPGSAANLASAVVGLMRDLPANEDWFSCRKVV